MQICNPFIITWLTLLKLTTIMFCRACGNAEYEVNRECCPMCATGHRVYRHCKGDSSTTCVECSPSTFMDVPNGLTQCFHCSVCDEGSGVRTKQECRSSADTLCEAILGYYCIETHQNSCRKARKHSTCSPGQYINKNGTAISDTTCKNCSEDTYSDGSFTICKSHRKCESMGQITTTQGTKSSDSICTDKRSHVPTVFAFLLHMLMILGVTVYTLYVRRNKTVECENKVNTPVTTTQGDEHIES